MEYEPVIGLEVHLQLLTSTKAFCGCSTEFAKSPNSSTCPVCLGFPGSLPVLNKTALLYSIKVALALNCKVANTIKFDRKNYFYPDLPKNYQISQFDMPVAQHGFLDIGEKFGRVKIRRVHLEEDAGKLMHKDGENASLVDYNRAGMPLLEIVSEPDIYSPYAAYEYLSKLKSVLEYLDVSSCDMEKGSLRVDANISLRPKGTASLGTKVELKNMNTFKGVRAGLSYEVKRQEEELSSGKQIVQDTRLWDAKAMKTVSMRTKEEAHDYRYFPEPDLTPFTISEEKLIEVRGSLPELPDERTGRLAKEYGLSDYDASCITAERAIADFFEASCKIDNKPKQIANWLTGDIFAYLNENNISLKDTGLKPENLTGMIGLIESGMISGKMAKEIVPEMLKSGKAAGEIIKEKGLIQITDDTELEAAIEKIISANKKSVDDYMAGKDNAVMFLVGQVMKETKGRANPGKLNQILRERLKK